MKKEKIVALVLTVAVGISTSPFGNLVSLAENEPDYLPEYFNIVTNSDAERNMVASSSNVLKYEQDNLKRIIDQGIQYTPIYSIEDLKNMERDYKKNYILMNDLDLSGENWIPIGTENEPFAGTFNGNGHCIRNMTIHKDKSYRSDNPEYVGLFGYGSNVKLKNIVLDNVNIDIEKTNYGDAYLKVIAGALIAGGGDIYINDCKVSGVNIDFNIDEKFACGGIAGEANSIENCEAEGKISANNCKDCDIGGIVGYGWKIYRCKNDINIEIETETPLPYQRIGGISGKGGKIEECVNTGSIQTSAGNYSLSLSPQIEVGGIKGEGGQKIINCYNCGDITVKVMDIKSPYSPRDFIVHAGGILGLADGINKSDSDKILNTYNSGQISTVVESSNNEEKNTDWAKLYKGEIVGGVRVSFDKYTGISKVQNSYYYDDEAMGMDNPAIELINVRRLIGIEAYVENSYQGFDFKNVWVMEENSYPKLRHISYVSETPEEPEIPEDPDESSELKLISIMPENGKTGVKNTDRIVLEFNKNVSSNPKKDVLLYVKDYDSDAILYEEKASGYSGMKKIFINNAFVNCPSLHCYIYIPENSFYSQNYDEESGTYEKEYFTGVTDKDQWEFWMETDKEICTVTYKLNNGENDVTRKFASGTPVIRPKNPILKGYTFIGWFLDSDCIEKYDFEKAITGDITLYAGWKVNEGGSGESDSDEITENRINGDNYSDAWKSDRAGKWKCYDETGNLLTGYQPGLYWNGIKGNWFFDENGNMLTGWHDGRYFYENANGLRGMEVTNKNILGYLQNDDGSSVLANYSYVITFVDDLDKASIAHSSLKNWLLELKATLMGIWDTVILGKGQGTSVEQYIADIYMKDSKINRTVLADLVNDMFKSTTWKDSFDLNGTINGGDISKIQSISKWETSEIAKSEKNIKDQFVNSVNEQFASRDEWKKLFDLSDNAKKAESNKLCVDYINKVIGASEELQKGLTDYSKNIEYLKSLKNSVPEGSTLSSSIDDLIQQYENQSISSFVNVLCDEMNIVLGSSSELMSNVNTMKNLLDPSNDKGEEVIKIIASDICGLNIGGADSIIKLASLYADDVSAMDKVVYSTYLRSEAISTLKNAEKRLKEDSNNVDAVRDYNNAFEMAKEATVFQYENMLKYYNSGRYTKSDKNKKVQYLNEEIAKLEKMSFVSYSNQKTIAYYDFK